MITSDHLYTIGYVAKTHGVKGELNITLNSPYDPEDFRFIIFDIESIFVPFEIDSVRGKGEDNRLVALKGVDTVEEARTFVGKTAYVLLSELERHPDFNSNEEDEKGLYLSDLIGYKVFDETGKELGTVENFNDDTQNFLLELRLADGNTVFIPYVDEWLVDLNQDNRTIMFNLPEGLI